MSTQEKSVPFQDAVNAEPLAFSDEQLFRGTDGIEGYPLLATYNPKADSDYAKLCEEVLNPAFKRLQEYDVQCEDACEVDEIRYKFAEHSNRLVRKATDYLMSRGCSPQASAVVGLALVYHDIGKTELPHEIWHVKDKEEAKQNKDVARTHSKLGSEYIRENWLPLVPEDNAPLKQFIEFMADIACYHHAEKEATAWCDKTLDELPLSIQVAAVVEGFDGHYLERDLTKNKFRDLSTVLEKMTSPSKQDSYDQALVVDFIQHLATSDDDFIHEVERTLRPITEKASTAAEKHLAPA